MKKGWKLYAEHIIESISKIELILKRGNIIDDSILYDATLRNLQTMSEAVRHLPDDIISDYPNIPWKHIKGFRNILVHDYLGDIDSKTILKIVESNLGPLKKSVQDIIDLNQ